MLNSNLRPGTLFLNRNSRSDFKRSDAVSFEHCLKSHLRRHRMLVSMAVIESHCVVQLEKVSAATNGGVDRATPLWFPCSSARCVASVQRMVLSYSEAAQYRRVSTIGLYRMLGPHCNSSPGFAPDFAPPTMWPKSNAEAGPSHAIQWQQMMIRVLDRQHTISCTTVRREDALPKSTTCCRPQDLPTHSTGRSLHRHATIKHGYDRTNCDLCRHRTCMHRSGVELCRRLTSRRTWIGASNPPSKRFYLERHSRCQTRQVHLDRFCRFRSRFLCDFYLRFQVPVVIIRTVVGRPELSV
ncbi:hypothetical protein Pla52n_44200 [Stieleria varia]|uniref:Uncharacterized protein n=1 Tax=Stieleria varia TaxID=2528005 RepID=A0A5C6AP50_9BACT|nr:hypothetical protein Pla52n_44200 [Stieleria varia]